MKLIQVLDHNTIDKIAAGEVIERPYSIVKELVENAIDAKASAITVEIKNGGVDFIRVTDNGQGIPKEEVRAAFLRHATSKIKSVEDLYSIHSLGFRGEALASIASISKMELITKVPDALEGIRFVTEGGRETDFEEVGAPNGSTFIARSIFYNTPVRKKFLKTEPTEGSYIASLVERLSLSNPGISFKFINNNQTKLFTSGNDNSKEIIYHIYGRDIANRLLKIDGEQEGIRISGYIGKPDICRSNRNFENYFINGRYTKNKVITKSIEEAYKEYLMQHKYPFTCLFIQMEGSGLDINVHPTKMEVRFSEPEKMYHAVYTSIKEALSHKELIPSVEWQNKEKNHKSGMADKNVIYPEPFEEKRKQVNLTGSNILKEDSVYGQSADAVPWEEHHKTAAYGNDNTQDFLTEQNAGPDKKKETDETEDSSAVNEQLHLFEDKFLQKDRKNEITVIGQVFKTYWLIEWKETLYFMDQHAAHEKVIYEGLIEDFRNKEIVSQYLSPPFMLSLTIEEEELFLQYDSYFKELGFEIEHFGGREYSVRAIPSNILNLDGERLFQEILDELASVKVGDNPQSITEKIASMSCKAAVKGNQVLSEQEIRELFDKLLSLHNPYHCPHGRPTIVSMTKNEMEKKFKRIL